MYQRTRRFGWKVVVMLVALAVAPLPLLAQDTAVTTTVQTEEEDSEFPWGLLGLLGLLGLIPRRRKDVHVHEPVRPAPPRDDRLNNPPPRV